MASNKKTQKTARGRCGEKAIEQLWAYRFDPFRGHVVYDENGKEICVLHDENHAKLVAKSPELLDQVLTDVLTFPEFETGEEVSGADAVEFLGLHHDDRKETLEHILGKKLVIDEETRRYARF
jgi:hypothetical protein